MRKYEGEASQFITIFPPKFMVWRETKEIKREEAKHYRTKATSHGNLIKGIVSRD
jgi:hypothetical protein